VKRADREARSRAPDRRLIQTPNGVLAIKLGWFKQTGVEAYMTLYGADGWPADTRSWFEQWAYPERNEDGNLPQVVSELTGMTLPDAEAFVEETVSRWRRSSAFERDVKANSYAARAIAVTALVAVLALVGVAALVWLVVSALT
jgi:hypothetical protein